MHSIHLEMIIRHVKLYLFLVILYQSPIISSENHKTACELLKLPRDCHCQRTRGVQISSLNETRLRCRQLTEVNTNHRWALASYDRLAFETPNDNLTVHAYTFADVRARTLRFDVQNLFLQNRAFDNAYIGQLAIARSNDYCTIDFQSNAQIFYGTTITNIFFKFIDFRKPISQMIFSNSRVYALVIQSSLFHGFTNTEPTKVDHTNQTRINQTINQQREEHDNFLEYDIMFMSSLPYSTINSANSTMNPLKIRRKQKTQKVRHVQETSDESSTHLAEETITINISAINLPAYISIYSILGSINTTQLTEDYFPNNIDYSQTDEIELSYNRIASIGPNAFRHLQHFQGRLILRHNQIESIDRLAFPHLNTINNLSLANNLLQKITYDFFENLSQLVQLDLRKNKIQYLDQAVFYYLTKLEVLHLSENPLKYLPKNIFDNLRELKEVHIENVDLFHTINEQSTSWMLNLGLVHGKHLIRSNFDLSDVAFCLLSRFNQTFYHFSQHHSCSCNVHYFFYRSDLETADGSIHKPLTKYLRLSPICSQNETAATLHMPQNENDSTEQIEENPFLIKAFNDSCSFQFDYLDCDAMILPTEPSTTTTESTTVTTTTTTRFVPVRRKALNDTRKLFKVLGILMAITIVAIILVILWYRAKSVLQRQQQRKKLLEQQRRLNVTSNVAAGHNHPSSSVNQIRSTATCYASSEMLTTLPTVPLNESRSQSLALVNSTGTTGSLNDKIHTSLTNVSVVKELNETQPIAPL